MRLLVVQARTQTPRHHPLRKIDNGKNLSRCSLQISEKTKICQPNNGNSLEMKIADAKEAKLALMRRSICNIYISQRARGEEEVVREGWRAAAAAHSGADEHRAPQRKRGERHHRERISCPIMSRTGRVSTAAAAP